MPCEWAWALVLASRLFMPGRKLTRQRSAHLLAARTWVGFDGMSLLRNCLYDFNGAGTALEIAQLPWR
jgi:hypothetical protein